MTTSDLSSKSAITSLTEVFDFLKKMEHPVDGTPFAQNLARLKHPIYRIAFVGRFQVGKSTLINRTFIKDATLLTSGEGLPTTAVATELKYGEAPLMEVFTWNTAAEGIPAANKLEVSSKVIERPTAADLARETANEDPTARTELSRKLARVVLEWPNESLKRYTLLDTPGIDDPDEVLLSNTTYRLLPECDLAVLLVPAAQLSKTEIDFLRQKLFDQGFTRLLVLVSHHADTQPRSATVLSRIMEAIRGQLDSIGRSKVPVQMFCYDETADGNMLKTPEQIEAAVVRFADEQAGPARIEKAVHLALAELHSASSNLQADIDASGKSAEERAAMLVKVRQEVETLTRRHDQIAASLNLRLRGAGDAYIADIAQGLKDVNKAFVDGFKAEGLDSGDAYDVATKHVRGAELFLQPKIQNAFAQAETNFQSALQSAIAVYTSDVSLDQDLALPATVTLGERSFLMRTLTQIPGYLVTIGDYVVVNGPLPGGPIPGLILRMLLGKMFENSKIMPADLLRKWLIEKSKGEISAALAVVQDHATTLVRANLQQVETQIKSGFNDLMAAEIKPLERVLQQPPTPEDSQNKQKALAWLEQANALKQQLAHVS
ncbi:dynamin family protein [Rhodoferax antarcticus]|uniref:dynamin family protein n=1 Tax=Rhodoferax antarcticus TaxID=81479 RepID=UPI0022240DF0|nr:dynamin family protein [Rhodoferax antarcticus]MCW2311319.1 hypothetical protein [Rhodoferax antarcticus]